MKKNQIGAFSSSDLIDAKLSEEHQLCGSLQCPGCGYKLEREAVWLGLPAGVKFDPTDQELIEHLDAKVGSQALKSHPLIDEFIPTIVGEDGICYTHPERLPGVTRDGLSKHFFHRPSKAYTTGTRKRRKIQNECDLKGGETRWHKTGKTRPVMVNGKQKGCKKILVLYTNFGRNRKPEKTNWVMHQYHLGQLEEEKDGDLVVSKIFYQTQPRQCNWSERSVGTGEKMGTRRDSGSGSCSSSKDFDSLRDEVSDGGAAGMVVSSHNVLDHQQINYDHFSFSPFRQSFDEVGEEEHTAAADASPRVYQEHEEHGHKTQHHLRHEQHLQYDYDQVTAQADMHVSLPSHPISTIVPPLEHTSGFSQEDSYHVSSIILQNERFQQEQQQHMLVGRPGPGFEELLMGCTSTDHRLREESSNTNTLEPEWLKYSFWHEPDNPYHHG